MMDCRRCGSKRLEHQATHSRPSQYKLSGLKDVFLLGITVLECPQCHSVSPVIPRLEQLHRLIAKDIVREPRMLRGDEIRFLRKNAGFSAKEFAGLLGIRPEHLSRVENGEASFRKPTDRLTRFLVTHQRIVRDVIDRMSKTQSTTGPPPQKQTTFEFDNDHWKEAAQMPESNRKRSA